MSSKSYQEILRELREDRDLTQNDVAGGLNTTQQMYSRYENGTCEMPIRHIKTLCRFYEVSADYILFNESQNAEEGRPSSSGRNT